MKLGLRIAAGVLCVGLALGCAGCQEDPEGSIVKHKDMDKLISQAAGAGSQEGAVDAAGLQEDVAQNFESYKVELADESLGVQLSADAQVDVPKVDKLSIFRVQQKKIDQELTDKLAQEFLGGETLYDGSILSVRLRSDIEKDIEYMRESIAQSEEEMRRATQQGDASFSEEEIENMKQNYQHDIDLLQEEYEKAPESLDYAQWPGSTTLKSVQDALAQNPDDGFAQWMKELNSNGNYCYAINDGQDGLYKSFYVQNNENYSNKLVYNCNPVGYPNIGGCTVNKTYLGGDEERYHANTAKDLKTFWKEKGLEGVVINQYIVGDDTNFEPIPGWTCEKSAEDAQAQAEAFLEKVGFEGFSLGRCELCSETLGLDRPGEPTGSDSIDFATYYILQFYREIDGVQLTQSSGVKYQDGWTDGDFKKEMWPGECIEMRVNDSGIVGFSLLAPVEITETVVEGAALKTFDEVKSTFESMALVARAREAEQVVDEVDTVRLSYSRISEKDSFDTGLIVPVWSFEGKESYYMDEMLSNVWEGPILAINAMDGTIIDAELGY